MEQTNAEQHLQNQRTENAINMQGEAFMALMKNVCTQMLYAVIGTGVALVLLYILLQYTTNLVQDGNGCQVIL